MADAIIRTENLGKVYRAKGGKVVAVENLNLRVTAGEIFGLLGPNGAGKTTTVRMLCGLLRPTHGRAYVDGLSVTEEPDEVRRRIGLVPEDAGDHGNLTLMEELEYHGAMYGLKPAMVRERSTPLIAKLGLADRANHRLKTYSKGMRRKCHLIRALLHEPRVLLLDEPTAGLDPAVVEEVWDLFKTLAAERQVTVILCSHHLEEVEKLCDHVAILKRHLLAEGSLSELSGENRHCRVELAHEAAPFAEGVRALAGVQEAAVHGQMMRLRVGHEARQIIPQVIRYLVEQGAEVVEVTRDGQDLRTLYKGIIANHLDQGEENA
ncbi:MAG: ABC transporter ATP-binding protein [Bacillota bacterium]